MTTKTKTASNVARQLGRAFLDRYPDEAAQVLEGASATQIARALAREAAGRAAAVLEHMSVASASEAIAKMDDERAARVLAQMDPHHAAGILASLEEAERERLLAALPARAAADLRDLMSYPPDSAGALMDTRLVVTFRPEQTVRDVVQRLRRLRRRRVNQIYLVDDEHRLLGIIPLQNVILASPGDHLGDIARARLIAVPVTASREEVVEAFTGSTLTSLPVVDFEGRLVGVVRQDALVTAASEEATADIQTMVGVGKDERALSPPLFAVRKRLPWLEINLLTAFLAASVVGLFEATIARYTALAVLLPVVAGQSGNTGAQALAVTLRGLALREVRTRQWPRVVTKEAAVGFLNGIAVAVTTSAGVWLWSGSFGLCLVIGVAMVTAMVIAGVAGAAIPLILNALGQDPAQSSSIVLTTVTDVFGFFSFLGLATLFADML